MVTAGSTTGPARAQAEFVFYVGEVFATAAYFCPRGTHSTEGQLFGVDERELGALREIFWNHYGGDGRVTLALPDLRGPKDPNSWEHTFKPGELRWCIALTGDFPDRGFSAREGAAGELMAFSGPGWCPGRWELESNAALPHQDIITWCKATGNAGEVNSFMGQMLLISGHSCPAKTLPADGQGLDVSDPANHPLYSLLGNAYGGDGVDEFWLPNPASPSPGVIWCIDTEGRYSTPG